MRKPIIFLTLICLFFLSQGHTEEFNQSTLKKESLTRELVLKLHEIGAVKFGSFILKSGIISPIYIDLRVIISDPKLLQQIGEAIWNEIKEMPCECLCGVPYTALPIATAISLKHNMPMVMRRKEAKNYGTKRIIEGLYQPGQKCIVIEDLVTSGGSVLETISPLQKAGLQVTDVAVLIDREQGGRENLYEQGYILHSVLTISSLLRILEEEQIISQETIASVNQFLQENRTR